VLSGIEAPFGRVRRPLLCPLTAEDILSVTFVKSGQLAAGEPRAGQPPIRSVVLAHNDLARGAGAAVRSGIVEKIWRILSIL
jgi:hypothetical protein